MKVPLLDLNAQYEPIMDEDLISKLEAENLGIMWKYIPDRNYTLSFKSK